MHEAKARLERPTTVIHVEDRAGVTHAIEPVEGWRLMEILRDYGLAMENTCGGALACAAHVQAYRMPGGSRLMSGFGENGMSGP